jgi:hypothetical protein
MNLSQIETMTTNSQDEARFSLDNVKKEIEEREALERMNRALNIPESGDSAPSTVGHGMQNSYVPPSDLLDISKLASRPPQGPTAIAGEGPESQVNKMLNTLPPEGEDQPISYGVDIPTDMAGETFDDMSFDERKAAENDRYINTTLKNIKLYRQKSGQEYPTGEYLKHKAILEKAMREGRWNEVNGYVVKQLIDAGIY